MTVEVEVTAEPAAAETVPKERRSLTRG